MSLAPLSYQRSSTASIAPWWHTAVVLVVMLGVSLIGARVELPSIFGLQGRAPRYLLAMAVEWLTVALVWWGVKLGGARFSDLIGGSWVRRLDIVRDCLIAIGFLVVFGGAVQALTSLFNATPPQALLSMMPRTPLEMILWVPLCVTGGFCEEVIFRGYFQRQFTALSHSVVVGIALQAIIFGTSHGYQGWKLMSIIAIYGACFGWLAHWRRSLRPGIVAHALQDTVEGLLARFLSG